MTLTNPTDAYRNLNGENKGLSVLGAAFFVLLAVLFEMPVLVIPAMASANAMTIPVYIEEGESTLRGFALQFIVSLAVVGTVMAFCDAAGLSPF
jgi:uncharacterized membrane protein